MPKITDDMLVDALRESMMERLRRREEAQVINNIQNAGSGGSVPSGVGGIASHLGGETPVAPDDDLFNYAVDITRNDLPINPDTGKPGGWVKHVKRYREKKGDHHPKQKA
jgi:hypothetical protein